MLRLNLWVLLGSFTASTFVGEESRFKVYWNVPSEHCFRKKIDIPLEKYGITVNEGQKFHGNKIVTFYEKDLGLYPYLFASSENDTTVINEGLPQKVNLSRHLEKAKEDIEDAIPDPEFDGLAVIDYEAWRPAWALNWGAKRVYRKSSIKFVLERQPWLSNKAARAQAQKEFNKHAILFMLRTIQLGKSLRPNAKWGFYGFPYCNTDAGIKGQFRCSKQFQDYNDRWLNVLHAESDALFPTIYFYKEYLNDGKRNFRQAQAVLLETQRIAAQFEQRKAIIAFTKMEYDPYEKPDFFYNQADLCGSVKQACDLGIDGLIVWSTSQNMKDRCAILADFVNYEFGPYVYAMQSFAAKCSEKECNGHGVCVATPQTECSKYLASDQFQCRCDRKWFGDNCIVDAKFSFFIKHELKSDYRL